MVVSMRTVTASAEQTPADVDVTQTPGDEPEDGAAVPANPAAGPTVDELIAELEGLRSDAPGRDGDQRDPRCRQLDRVDPAARRRPDQTRGLVPEDTMIVQRRARLDRTPDGRLGEYPINRSPQR